MNVVNPTCDLCTTLTAPVTVDQLTLQVFDSTPWPDLSLPPNVGFRFLIGVRRRYDLQIEYMWVTATAGNNWTVERNPSGCRDTLYFARNDFVFNPITEPLALVLGCYQQITP